MKKEKEREANRKPDLSRSICAHLPFGDLHTIFMALKGLCVTYDLAKNKLVTHEKGLIQAVIREFIN